MPEGTAVNLESLQTMIQTKPILLRGKPLGNGAMPAIIAPLVATTRLAIVDEVQVIVAKQPDVLEWRVDFFEAIGDIDAVIDTARAIQSAANGLPLLLTRRHQREGGTPIAIDEAAVVAMYSAACAAQCVDLIDYELSNSPDDLARLREVSAAKGIAMIMSHHNFQRTPDAATLDAKFAEAERLGADIAKLAVMPESVADVLSLLSATERASRSLSIPLISMSMGGVGALSRIMGWVCGSAATFAIGQSSSAPGQVAIDELRAMLASLHRAVGD